MKRVSILIFAALIFAALSASAQMPAVHQVYIMPMAGGLDQYLAEWLTRDHVVQVVADPKAADAVFTDRLGEAFEERLNQIHPAEMPVAVLKDEKKNVSPDAAAPATIRAFHSSIARGTLFLVDAKSRQVLWSDYERPRRPSDANLNHQAERVAKKLLSKPAK